MDPIANYIPLASLVVALGAMWLTAISIKNKADRDYVHQLEARLISAERRLEEAERRLEDCRAETMTMMRRIIQIENGRT